MNRFFAAMILLFMAALPFAATSQAAERSEVDDMDKWKLEDLYPTIEAFKAEMQLFQEDVKKLADYQGRLTESAETLLSGLEIYNGLEMRIRKMEGYAHKRLDQDTRVSANQAYQGEVSTIRATFAEASAFVDPELTAAGEAKLNGYFAAEPKLKPYQFPIREALRMQKHILPPDKEEILAAVYDFAGGPESIYSVLTEADMPKPTITLEDGSEIKLSYDNFDKVRRSSVDADRKKAFDAFFGAYSNYKRTLAQTLYNQLKVYKFYSKTRDYDSTLQAALDANDINPELYTSLIQAAHDNLATFHRYLKLKARFLGKERLDYTDLYVPFTRDVTIEVDYEKAKQLLLEAFKPMGSEYVNTIESAFNNRWIDVYPTEGKRSGAYASGWAYDTHPFVLMNFNNTYSDALTLAHELGHAMHSYYSNSNQPFPTADYATFVAEVASIFNENLLNDYMLKKVESDEERLYLLGNFLDGTFKGTFFRQIQFAEFELMIHQKVEAGDALTDEELNRMYIELTRKYYGHDQGVVNVPDVIAVEWAVIPHFYYDYYVFQYSTSAAAAGILSEQVLNGDKKTLNAYYQNLLKAGGSEPPVELLQKAGADMTNPAAYKALMDKANRYMDELEKILNKRKK